MLSRLLAGWFSSVFEALKLAWLNKLLGGAIGGFKGAILISLLLVFLSVLPVQSFLNPIKEKSYFYNPLENLLPSLYSLFSSSSATDLNKKLEDIFRKNEQKVKKQIIETMLNEAIDSTDVR
jgi:hypothetical protein